MLWTERAKEMYSDSRKFVKFCNFICFKRKDKEFLEQFNLIKNESEASLVTYFLIGANINDASVVEDMELLMNQCDSWNEKEE